MFAGFARDILVQKVWFAKKMYHYVFPDFF